MTEMSDTTIATRSGRGRGATPDRPAVAARWQAFRAPIAGAVGVLAGIGLSELVGGFLGGPSLLASIGHFVIDNQPAGAKDVIVSLFGTNDKLALEALIVIVASLVGAGLGVLAVRRSVGLASAGFWVFAIAGFLAALTSPSASPTTAILVALVAAVAGSQVMSFLLRGATVARASSVAAVEAPEWSRRSFILQAAGIAVGSSLAAVVGRRLLENGL